MKSPLKTLSKIQKFNIDEQRKKLLELQLQEDDLVNSLKKLNEEFEREKEFSKKNEQFDFGNYLKRHIARREDLEERIKRVRVEIEQVRDKISDLYKEQKTYDIVDEAREQRAAEEDNAKERIMLDEIGTNAYIKRHSKK
jgi:hypothetical protein